MREKLIMTMSKILCAGLVVSALILCLNAEAADSEFYFKENNITYKVESGSATVVNIGGTSTEVVIPSEIIIRDTDKIYSDESCITEAESNEGNYFYSVVKIYKQNSKSVISNTNLTTLTIPESVKLIGSHAFMRSATLRSVTIQGNGLKTIGPYVFMECSNLTSIELPNSITKLYEAFQDSGLVSITIPSSVKEIESGTFAGCTNLTSVTMPASVNAVGEEAFVDCPKLETITVANESVYDFLTEQLQIYISNTVGENTVFGRNDISSESSPTPTDIQIIYKAPEVTKPVQNTQQTWIPTEDHIYRASLKGGMVPVYEELNKYYEIRIENEIQGPLCINVFNAVRGQYTLANTYNIFVNDQLIYSKEDSAKICLRLPLNLPKEGRVFQIICVSENGQPYIYKDLDSDPNTITFETNKFYAYGLCYLDK